MVCDKIKEYLYEYETGRLNEETFNEIDKHLNPMTLGSWNPSWPIFTD